MKAKRVRDVSGWKSGVLTVVEKAHIKNRKQMWLCKCDCGNECYRDTSAIATGRVQSCGCLQKKATSEAKKTHGMADSRLYRTWGHMKHRCSNPNDKHYHRYGGRGILVCKEWLSFENFMAWALENGYEESLTIDRVDNNGDYSPENCRWIPHEKNSTKRFLDNPRVLPVNVYHSKHGDRYQAHAWSGHYIGTYDTIAQAKQAVEAALVA
jgi:hypothetical protein